MTDRPAPHRIEAERAVLGAAMASGKRAQALPFELQRDDFFLPAHREIYEAIAALAKAGKRADRVSLGVEMERRRTIPKLEGGTAYLAELESAGDRFGWDQHVRLIRDASSLRAIMAACGEAAARAAGNDDAAAIVEELGRRLVQIATHQADDLTPLGSVMPAVLEAIERRAREKRAVTGVRLGVEDIDNVTTGFQPGNLVTIAALTGAGKTAAAMQAAINLALRDGGTVLAFNLEMTRMELAERILVHEARMDSAQVRRGDVDYAGFKNQLQPTANRLAEASIFLEDNVFGLADLMTKARIWRSRFPERKGLVIVDFVQLVQSGEGARDGRARQLGLVAQALKRLAKELAVPVIMVSQLNRVAAKSGEEPTIADLKDSSEIEQLSDVVILCHNGSQTADGPVTMIVGKNRHGQRARVTVRWIGRFYRFEDDIPPVGESRYAE